jgi:predicted DNA-binding protein (MmcQ/YjbR family)
MSHPLRFDEADPFLARVREICLAFPEAAEKISHGAPAFYTQKVFAYYGGSIKGDHYAPFARIALLFKADPLERAALLEEERCFLPAHLGPAGWVGLSFLPALAPEGVAWDEVAELIDTSYRLTAPTRLVRQLPD